MAGKENGGLREVPSLPAITRPTGAYSASAQASSTRRNLLDGLGTGTGGCGCTADAVPGPGDLRWSTGGFRGGGRRAGLRRTGAGRGGGESGYAGARTG